jgi:hypothetical protein
LRDEGIYCKNWKASELYELSREARYDELEGASRRGFMFMFLAVGKQMDYIEARRDRSTNGEIEGRLLDCPWEAVTSHPDAPVRTYDGGIDASVTKIDVGDLPMWALASGGITHMERLLMYKKLVSCRRYRHAHTYDVEGLLAKGRKILDLERERSKAYGAVGSIGGGDMMLMCHGDLEQSCPDVMGGALAFTGAVRELCGEMTNRNVALLKQLFTYVVEARRTAKAKGAKTTRVGQWTQ